MMLERAIATNDLTSSWLKSVRCSLSKVLNEKSAKQHTKGKRREPPIEPLRKK